MVLELENLFIQWRNTLIGKHHPQTKQRKSKTSEARDRLHELLI